MSRAWGRVPDRYRQVKESKHGSKKVKYQNFKRLGKIKTRRRIMNVQDPEMGKEVRDREIAQLKSIQPSTPGMYAFVTKQANFIQNNYREILNRLLLTIQS